MNITQDELLDALSQALAKPTGGDGSTVDELAAAMQCSVGKIRKMLKAIAGQNRLVVIRAYRPTIDGRQGLVPLYQVKP